MGNQASELSDDPTGSDTYSSANNSNFKHFDHTFKGEIHTTSGSFVVNVFGECKYAKREIQVNCKGSSFEIIEEIGLKSKKQVEIQYKQITTVSWDHSNSEVKIDFKNNDEACFVILTMANTIEFEGEMKLRLNTPGVRPPPFMYVGMFAGESKPKPFQRKRPNLSHLPVGKLPPLHDMRNQALELHKGSYKPCAQGVSRRIDLAVQHIYEGYNYIPIVRIKGAPGIANQWRPESVLGITDEAVIFKPFGSASQNNVEFRFEDISDWKVEDNEHVRPHDSSIEFELRAGGSVSFVFAHIRDARHTLEFYWNSYCVSNGLNLKLGSTHGRPIVTVTTLSGEVPATERPVGQWEVVDLDGIVVRPGGKMAPRAKTLSLGGSKEIKIVPPEIKSVKAHWPRIVLHQGWLLKKGGVGIGTNKSWLKRYFVLYKTSQGHFLTYYADFTECPLFSTERGYRNVIDLAKCTFIRPGSIREKDPDSPPNCFDIVTIEREWTLCAETQENARKWLILLTRAVDEDVAILPDEELLFKVKPKVDATGIMPATDYSTSLRISAHGISVNIPDTNTKSSALSTATEKEIFFWVYTDFYKWSLLSQMGKLAILVNVFADSSFTRRNEFIFRNKEAVRLASSIEYFIEKFMCVMHIRLETMEGAFDNVPPAVTDHAHTANNNSNNNHTHDDTKRGMHSIAEEDIGHQDEIDLLDLDMGDMTIQPPAGGSNSASHTGSVDPFGDSLFGADSSAPSPAAAAYKQPNNQSVNLFDDDDLLSTPAVPISPMSSPPKTTPVVATTTTSSMNPFGDDPFGQDSNPFGAAAATTASLPVAPSQPKIAPPLSPAQEAQHLTWLRSIFARSSGSFYDDGSLQIAITIEVRGSQGRISFFYRNQSPSTINDLQLKIEDDIGLTRFELGPGPTTIPSLSSANNLQQQLMLECMKPVPGGPKVSIHYIDTLLGRRQVVMQLPIAVTTFNDPLALSGSDFMTRWDSLTSPGLQAQEIFSPTQRIVPAEIAAGLSTAMHFGPVTGVPGESEFVIHGAASLRTGTCTPTGDKISIGCLAKVEMNVQTNAIRVTVRTLHPAATSAIMAAAKLLLG